MPPQTNLAQAEKEECLGPEKWKITLSTFWLRMKQKSLDHEKWLYEAGGRMLSRVEAEMVSARMAEINGLDHETCYRALQELEVIRGARI